MEQKEQNIQIENINENTEVQELDSLCMSCLKQGKTRLMLTKIPFFKEVLISSFSCEECGYKNSEIQQAGGLETHGVHITLKMIRRADLNRSIVTSEHCSIKFVELDLEIPANNKGSINTIEGILKTAYDGMSMTQEQRRLHDPSTCNKLQPFLAELQQYKKGDKMPLTVILDDPSGNSYISNPYAPSDDPQMKHRKYLRTLAMNHQMGYYPEQEQQNQQDIQQEQQNIQQNLAHRFDFTKPLTDDVKGESLAFEVPCHACLQLGSCKMCSSSIPYFKEIIIMSFSCEHCGAHSTEVKTGGALSSKGRKMTLNVTSEDDLRRDVFKSDSAYLSIPQLELELEYGTLGGVFTTVEGILQKIISHLKDNVPFMMGDTSEHTFTAKINQFFNKMEALQALQSPFTLVIDDPLDNSFIQNPYYPEEDPRIVVEVYERTEEQNDEFGILHMQTENYQKKDEEKQE